MPLENPSYVAYGNIRPFRICVPRQVTPADHSNDNVIVEATNATVRPVGISQQGGRNAPLPANAGTVYAAADGEPLMVAGPGAAYSDLLLGGTVYAGNMVMATTDGTGIVATVGNYHVARAREYGVLGDRIPVQVDIGLMHA
jgi:hypothetical protein